MKQITKHVAIISLVVLSVKNGRVSSFGNGEGPFGTTRWRCNRRGTNLCAAILCCLPSTYRSALCGHFVLPTLHVSLCTGRSFCAACTSTYRSALGGHFVLPALHVSLCTVRPFCAACPPRIALHCAAILCCLHLHVSHCTGRSFCAACPPRIALHCAAILCCLPSTYRSTLGPLHATTGRAAIIAFPICREWVCPCVCGFMGYSFLAGLNSPYLRVLLEAVCCLKCLP